MDMNWENAEMTLGGNETIFIDIWSPEDAPSTNFHPVFEKVAAKHEDVAFARINTHEEPGLAEALGIARTPTLMVVKKRQDILQKTEGIEEQTLDDLVEVVREIDVDELILQALSNQD